ncbi:pantetheine-phosphate adenylyltransferase [Sulfurovum sp. zt1-1]|uniref:Phosphopantetheine adenylyltransferase n=1 Tax=Sulfurovum zhangzhouensis TaxID=3019067 RepID=A0ABT7QVD6_9BACT|nr:pantetheine-phosphate adenylyltransferase [Sulfurovum zhangzhouensis]MDM5270757.1 pantetheine-phosphate adenylyltransferase [Sulfurovum zhangzhouensis]
MSTYKRAIYPGTFDPITNGHLDIIRRAHRMFDEIIIAVAESEAKKPMFNFAQRVHMVKAVTADLPNIQVRGFNNLLVNLSDELDANIIIRGLRAVSDFEYELQMGYANASLKKELETIYLMPSLEHAFVSSSVVRTILNFDGKVEHLVPPKALELIKCER